MKLTDKQQKWIIAHFKNTKNDVIVEKLQISHSSLHRFARENGLKKTKQFQRKCQTEASEAARIENKRNNWPPKGYIIPGSINNRFKMGVTPEQRLGKKKNAERIKNSADSRKKTIHAEKRRVLFGLPQKTKLKVVAAPHNKVSYRHLLKKRGYVFDRDAKTIFYNENTNRSNIVERTASERYRFQIMNLITMK